MEQPSIRCSALLTSTRVSDTSPGGHSPSVIYIYIFSLQTKFSSRRPCWLVEELNQVFNAVDLKKNSSVLSHSRTGYCYRKWTKLTADTKSSGCGVHAAWKGTITYIDFLFFLFTQGLVNVDSLCNSLCLWFSFFLSFQMHLGLDECLGSVKLHTVKAILTVSQRSRWRH